MPAGRRGIRLKPIRSKSKSRVRNATAFPKRQGITIEFSKKSVRFVVSNGA
jgi:hypothetical protein